MGRPQLLIHALRPLYREPVIRGKAARAAGESRPQISVLRKYMVQPSRYNRSDLRWRADMKRQCGFRTRIDACCPLSRREADGPERSGGDAAERPKKPTATIQRFALAAGK